MDTQHNPNEPGKPTAPGQQGGNSRIAKDRSVNVSSASAKKAANRAVASKADDKTGSLRTERAAGDNSRRFDRESS